MSNQFAVADGVMEGDGAYNKHAKIQAEGAAVALPFLGNAVQNLALDAGYEPIVIADYGSSQGKNSLSPMRAAIRGLRERIAAERPIVVIHIDQAANDFNTLFAVLGADPEGFVCCTKMQIRTRSMIPRSIHLQSESPSIRGCCPLSRCTLGGLRMRRCG